MNLLAPGALLAQVRPATTAAVTAFTASQLPTEITTIKACNTSGAARTCRIFHDDDGSTYDESTALYWDIDIPANKTLEISAEAEKTGIYVAKDGTIGVRSDAASGITFSMYGVPRAAR